MTSLETQYTAYLVLSESNDKAFYFCYTIKTFGFNIKRQQMGTSDFSV